MTTRAVNGALLCLTAAMLAPAVGVAAELPAASAARESAARQYRIDAGPLATVLGRFAAAAGVALSFDPASTRDRTSTGLDGNFTIDAGFAQLLSGTGLEAVDGGGGAYTLREARLVSAPAATLAGTATTLATVRVVARAAPAPVEADDSYQPTPDASTLRTTASTLEIPQVVNVVPAQVIRDQRPRNIDDALVNVSGITQGNTLASTQDTIMKRGFGANRDGSIMHNGMPLVQGRGMNAAAESVEVLKGPASMLYGIMDPGGVINVVSKKPQLEQKTKLSLGGSGYAGGRNGGNATVDTTGPIGDNGLAYRLVVDHIDEDYWRNFGTHRETLVAPSLAWYGDDTQIVAWYEYRKYLTPFDRGTALSPATRKPLDLPKRQRLDEPYNEMKGETHLAQLSVDHQLGGGWAAHLNLSYNRETYDANQLRINGVNTARGTLTRNNDATHGALSTDTYGTVYVDGKLQLAGMRHEVQFGGDLEYRKIYRADLIRGASSTNFSYLNPVYGLVSPSNAMSASDSGQSDQLHNQAAFFQDSIHLSDRLIAVAGLRYQAWQQLAGRGRPFNTNTDTDDSTWLPRAGLIYKLTDTVSLYGSYTESLRPSSTIAPLASGQVITSGIEPEQAKSWEVGAKLDIPGNLTGTLALFDIKKKNVLVSQFNDVTKLTDWRTSGAARSRGLELDLAGQINARWSMIGSYAYLDAKTTEDPLYAGLRLWNTARQTASLYAVYNAGQIFGDGQLRLGGGARYVGNRPGDSANSFTLPSYTTADVFATYDTRIGGRNVKFQLNVKNLFDKTYYPSSVNTYFVSMGDARQISFLTSIEF
ncbi:TonB-dependent receptor [Pigmentiphaga aceris]|uniref:TonB-dependent receptor n=2 Tax=Pigmentiphaga aceris TaxID=1940612 RepID=A0A5C0B5N9_9BURK|nr:TonB-dependent receptor [Pigmentiphaga aceris]QEI09266.1 TonB-dependent receptor [Pigmentiphaga aceris]